MCIFKMGRKNKPQENLVAGLTRDQANALARLERNSYKLIKKCWQCGAVPRENVGFSWAAIVLLDEELELRPEEIYVVRYEFLHAESEHVYLGGKFKSVSFTF